MAWQVGEQQTVPLVCYLDGVATAPTAPIITQVNVEGAGFAETTNAATDEGNGAVSVVLEANEVGAWGFVRVVGDNGAEGVQPYTAEGDWTKARAEQIDDLALEATLDAIKGATFDASTDSLEALRDAGDSGAWSSTAGGGANEVTVTASDGAGVLANSLKISVRDAVGNEVANLCTDSLGVATFYLDDATYTFVTATTTMWQGSSTEAEVSGDTAIALTLTAQTLPVPSSADKYTIIINAADEFADLVGADEWAISIKSVTPRGLDTANLVQLTQRTPITLDANGQASFEVSRETESFTLTAIPTLADATTGSPVDFFCTVNADDADESGRIYLSDMITS